MMLTIYKGTEITLNERHKFAVKVGEEDMESFESYEQACEYIDRIQKLEESKEFKQQLSLKVLDDRGKEKTVTGINRATKELTGVQNGRVRNYKDKIKDVYPPELWIAETIALRSKMRQQLQDIENQLDPFEIDVERRDGRYGRIEDAGRYNKFITVLKEEYERKCALARERKAP